MIFRRISYHIISSGVVCETSTSTSTSTSTFKTDVYFLIMRTFAPFDVYF